VAEKVSYLLFVNRDGEPVGNIVILLDISAQKKAEKAFKKYHDHINITESNLKNIISPPNEINKSKGILESLLFSWLTYIYIIAKAL